MRRAPGEYRSHGRHQAVSGSVVPPFPLRFFTPPPHYKCCALLFSHHPIQPKRTRTHADIQPKQKRTRTETNADRNKRTQTDAHAGRNQRQRTQTEANANDNTGDEMSAAPPLLLSPLSTGFVAFTLLVITTIRVLLRIKQQPPAPQQNRETAALLRRIPT